MNAMKIDNDKYTMKILEKISKTPAGIELSENLFIIIIIIIIMFHGRCGDAGSLRWQHATSDLGYLRYLPKRIKS